MPNLDAITCLVDNRELVNLFADIRPGINPFIGTDDSGTSTGMHTATVIDTLLNGILLNALRLNILFLLCGLLQEKCLQWKMGRVGSKKVGSARGCVMVACKEKMVARC